MTAVQNKELVGRMIDEVWNEEEAAAISRYDAPEIRTRYGGITPS